MGDDLFLKFCCLYKQLKQLSNEATVPDLERLITPCFIGDEVFEARNQSMKIRTTVRWFLKNATQYSNEHCPQEIALNECDMPTQPGKIVYVSIWAFIMAMIVCTNILVISAIIKVPNLRSNVANLFIMSLSLSDLCVGIFVVPVKAGFAKHNMRFCFNMDVCRFYIIADTTFFVTSIMNLLVIAVDRHLALNYPYKYPNWMTRPRAKLIICFTWLYGIISGALTNLKFDNVNGNPIRIQNKNCSMSNNTFYVYILFFLNFGVPVLVMGIIYFRILMITKHHARNISESSIMNNNNNNNFTVIQNEKHSTTNEKQQHEQNNNNNGSSKETVQQNTNKDPLPVVMTLENQNTTIKPESLPSKTVSMSEHGHELNIKKADRYVLRRSSSKTIGQYRKLVLKATKIVAVVYGTYVLCWFPTCVFSIALSICRPCFEDNVNIWFYIIGIEILPIANSMLNVFIYALMNNEFRRGFKKMLNSVKLVKFIKQKLNCN